MQSMKDCCCCCRCRRCCFRAGRDFAAFVEATVSRCMPERLTFVSTVVRILWNILVIFHGWLGRFEAYIIEVLFLLVQFRTVFHHPRIMKIHSEIVRSIQWWYLYWVINFKFFLQFYWSKIDGYFLFSWCLSWALRQWNDASATAHELLDYEFSSVGEFLTVQILYLCTNSSRPKNISHVRKWYCSFELSQGVYKNFWINGCPSMQQSGELSKLFVTLGFPISIFLWVYTSRIRVCTRDSLNRTISGVCTSFFPRSHLRVSRTPRVLGLLEELCPKDTLCRETRQHAPAFTF